MPQTPVVLSLQAKFYAKALLTAQQGKKQQKTLASDIKETVLTLALLAVIMAVLFAAILCVLRAHESGVAGEGGAGRTAGRCLTGGGSPPFLRGSLFVPGRHLEAGMVRLEQGACSGSRNEK